MIESIAFCPHPPALVPEVGSGAVPELAALRAACRTAINRVAAPGRQLVVLGAGPAARMYSAAARGSFAAYGVALEVSLGASGAGPLELPLSLAIGAWLVRDALGPDSGAVGFSVGPGEPDLTAGLAGFERTALLVMGDGSARRSTAAPGYLDERAAAYDARVAAALRGGNAAALHLDVALGAELLAAGAPAWAAAARLLNGDNGDSGDNGDNGDNWDAELLYSDAPFGVGYFVAAWTSSG